MDLPGSPLLSATESQKAFPHYPWRFLLCPSPPSIFCQSPLPCLILIMSREFLFPPTSHVPSTREDSPSISPVQSTSGTASPGPLLVNLARVDFPLPTPSLAHTKCQHFPSSLARADSTSYAVSPVQSTSKVVPTYCKKPRTCEFSVPTYDVTRALLLFAR
jgi:hypothetical protein